MPKDSKRGRIDCGSIKFADCEFAHIGTEPGAISCGCPDRCRSHAWTSSARVRFSCLRAFGWIVAPVVCNDWIRLATQHQWRSTAFSIFALLVRRKGNSSQRTRSYSRLDEQGGSGNRENASSDNLHAPSISPRRHLGDRLTGCGGAEPTSITLVSRGQSPALNRPGCAPSP